MKNYNRIIDVFSILILISVAYCSFWDVFLFVPNYYLFVFLYGFVFFYKNNKPIKLLILCLLIAISSIKHIFDYSTNFIYSFFSYTLLSIIAFIIGSALAYWANARSKKLYLYFVSALSPMFFYLAAVMLSKNYYFGIVATGLSVYFLTFFLYSEKWSMYQIASTLILPISLFFLMLNLDAEPSVLYTINATIVISLIFALLAHTTGKRYLFSALNIVTSLFVFPLILVNAQNYRSLRETFIEVPKSKFIYKSDTISLDIFKDKILILDFWHTRCGPCYKKFPELNQLYKQYADNPNVKIFAVNIPLSVDTVGEAVARIGSKDYEFDNLFALDRAASDSFLVSRYPTLVFIDKNSKIRYSGNLNLDRFVWNNTPFIINKLLHE